MKIPTRDRDEQSALWNGAAGQAWVQHQVLLDGILKPLEEVLTAEVRTVDPRSLLDVGCGTGATTLAAARRQRQYADILGIDVSAPMITAARARAKAENSPARFLCADAQDFAFEPGTFEMIISRLGVMFFADPSAAFRNLRRAAADNAQLRMIAWRSADDNPFMTTAEHAAAPLLPTIPARTDGPGQFTFADADFVEATLCRSGWQSLGTRPIDLECSFPASERTRYFSGVGPLGRVLGHADGQTRAAVIEAVRTSIRPYVHGDRVRFNAALWMIAARPGRLPKEKPHE